MRNSIIYFDKPGKENTEETLKFAFERAKELNIKQVVVASTHGYTADMASRFFSADEYNLIAVTICASYDDMGWTMTTKERSALEDKGIKVLTCLHSLGDDVNEAFKGDSPNKIVRETLYTFCQGMKVAVEIALMASDAGLLDMSQDVISIAGTGEGADTAIILKPAYARRFNEMQIKEILAKPR